MEMKNVFLPVQCVCNNEMSPILVCGDHARRLQEGKKAVVGVRTVLQRSRVRQSKEGSIFGLNQEAADMRHGGALNALQVSLPRRKTTRLKDAFR